MVASDNSSVVAYLKNQGGTHSPSLCMLVWELLYWCHHRNIPIQVRHIPGKLNVLADSLSRPDRILPVEWSLDREIAHQIFSLWGTPQIDLFATRLNHLLPLFVSPVPDHRACAVDAMSLEWKNLFAYAFPPFKLVPLVLNKIRDSSSRFILIAPLASEELVFSHFESHNRLSQGTSSSSGFGITTSGKSTPSESSYVAISRLEVVRSQIRGRHISEFATQCISQSRRESTLKVYSARWKIFLDWCLQREVNPVDPALNDLVDFFCYLFDTLKLSVASIKGYRSAISNTLKFSKSADCTADPIISDLIKGFALRKPVSRSLTPKWNLTYVLWSLNKAPYEPLKTADIKYITLKAVFHLTFAAARRRSEIHALSIEEGCFRYDRNSDSITLLTQPGFLAKNQLPESLPEPIVIPGLSQFCGSDTDDRLLCPVRAVRAYLSRVKAKRSGRKRLFLPLKGSKDISPSTISRWICDVIKLAYADLSSSDLSFMKISAHEVRALSSSWAYWNSVALEDVVRAAYWRTNSTFSSFYLRDLAPIRQDTSSLGPLVAAQSITGCHRSVS